MHVTEYVTTQSTVLVVCAEAADAGPVARGLVSQLSRPTCLFEVVGDDLTNEQAAALLAALAGPEPIVLFGGAESELLARLARYWPEYVEEPDKPFTIAGNVELHPTSNGDALPAMFVVVPEPGQRFGLREGHRCRVWRLTAVEAQTLGLVGNQTPVAATLLGFRHGREVSFRALCLMHEWDTDAAPSRSVQEIIDQGDTDVNWADLSSLLRAHSDVRMLDEFHGTGRVSDDRYAFFRAATRFLQEREPGPVYPDVYAAVWFMEPAVRPGTFFRGQYSAEWELASTLLRPPPAGLDIDELESRLALTREFTGMLRARSDEFFGCQLSDDDLLAVAQHFGFPTPLLDYTRSMRVAAFFATHNPPAEAMGRIGVIYYMHHALERTFAPARDTKPLPPLTELCGVRLGSLKVIEPRLPTDENRIQRQQGVFISGYRPRDAASVTIDRIYFYQQPNVIFEDPRSGITRLDLMPEDTPVARLAGRLLNAWHKDKRQRRPSAGGILGGVRLDESSIIGSSVSDLYWQLHEGQKLLGEALEQAQRTDPPITDGLANIVCKYFTGARIQANVAEVPEAREKHRAFDPLYDAVEALERLAGLGAGALWNRLSPYVRSPFEPGSLDLEAPPEWPLEARLGLGCALFLSGWEQLRSVDCDRARDLVQTALDTIATAGGEGRPKCST